MFRKASSQLHLPLLALLLLALTLSTATLAFSSRTLSLFNTQQSSNPWLLPIWRGHFDLRGLKLVVGTSAAIVLCDLVAVLAATVSLLGVRTIAAKRELQVVNLINDQWSANKGLFRQQLPHFSTSTSLTSTAVASLTATLLALPATILPLVLNARAPTKDTLQSWTCSWVSSGLGAHNGMPGDFSRVCGESRFASHAPLALLLLHLAILATCLLALRKSRKAATRTAAAASLGEEDGEKMVELGEYEKFSSSKDRV